MSTAGVPSGNGGLKSHLKNKMKECSVLSLPLPRQGLTDGCGVLGDEASVCTQARKTPFLPPYRPLSLPPDCLLPISLPPYPSLSVSLCPCFTLPQSSHSPHSQSSTLKILFPLPPSLFLSFFLLFILSFFISLYFTLSHSLFFSLKSVDSNQDRKSVV